MGGRRSRAANGRRRALILGLLIAGGLLLAALAWATRRELDRPGRVGRFIAVAGEQRSYWLHLPRRYDGRQPLPLVVVLHWAVGSGLAIEQATGFSDLADRHGFIVVYPDGTGQPRTWNAGYCCGAAATHAVDDIGFLRTLLDELVGQLAIDRDRIYLTGMSNGGMLAHWAGAALSDRVAAIAVVAGAVGGQASPGGALQLPGSPAQPVPVLIIHGRLDEQVPYAEPSAPPAGQPVRHLPVSAAVDFWRSANGADRGPDRLALDEGRVIRQVWTGSTTRALVRLDTHNELGHDWPGARGGWRTRPPWAAGRDRATAEIWAFFSAQRR